MLRNPHRRKLSTVPRRSRAIAEFHRTLANYAVTPLLDLPGIAGELGVGRVLAKDESCRFGLPSFKIMGASWAVRTALVERLGLDRSAEMSFQELRALTATTPLCLATATDGNHGRAVAHMAALLELESVIYVPENTLPVRIVAIESEGATVIVVDGDYDHTVAYAADASASDPRTILVSDTSWPGYERIPAAVVDGYGTIMDELAAQLAEAHTSFPDVTVVQMGVGSFASAVLAHLRGSGMPEHLQLVGVEPASAACVLASLAAGRRLSIEGPFDSIMAGLNCGTPSLDAWPALKAGLDISLSVEDEDARIATRDFAAAGISAGECAGAALAGLRTLLGGDHGDDHRHSMGITPNTTVLLFVTEGVTGSVADSFIEPTSAQP